MSNLNRTKVRRESTNTMPSALPLGEVAFNSETSELFVGTGTGKDKVTDPELIKSVNQLSSQLDNKANQIDVDENLFKKRDKSELIKIGDLSQDVKESMTGGSVAVVKF